ncbi:VOC family protein [Acetobacterium woodii]|uniref:PhnB-like domain-containing protein n=1 Tax=Acetobacterium woodii (strain ATCC 29683 / DSM 1030 / JCM 2381 / KCTC 1655 / WB1) TaxID=931626 RepID=H6LKL0_ACEWD|nr:VOC family protein [Acetobacterium woodii]AFA48802.1 hypothetical protein Awo_c20240 [Acetobacterium woodii DSM 1030]
MQIQPYVSFNENCRGAVEFYADVFGTDKTEIILFGETVSEHVCNKSDNTDAFLINDEKKRKDTKVMLSDIPPDDSNTQSDKITLIIVSDDLDEIKILYFKLKEGGIVETELQETFWSKYYGSLIDKFGVSWQLNYDDGRMKQVL